MNNKLFLSAKWKNLILATYKVPPALLEPHLPNGLELDIIGRDAFLSLVAFDFLDIKVKGIKIPFHVNFPEINLRFYVRNKERRGVVFIKELVPRYFTALFARIIYNENYRSTKMKRNISIGETIRVEHIIKYKGNDYSISVNAENKTYMPPPEATEHFFKEHEWGFGSTKKGEPLIYRVEHPFWNVYPVKEFHCNFDFGVIYGEKWKSLNDEKPYNIILAEGSEIKVFGTTKV